MILFNIWDDYYDDNAIPEGEFQETFGKVEGGTDDEEGVISVVYSYLALLHLPEVEITKEFDEIHFKNLSHEMREQLVEWLNQSNLKFQGNKIDFYSES